MYVCTYIARSKNHCVSIVSYLLNCDNILHIVPPNILASPSTYTSFIGSNVVLRCNIIDKGTPPAEFSWSKAGYRMNGEYIIVINSTAMEITFLNLTLDNAGVYTCAADGLLSYHSDSVELIVQSKSIYVTISL